MSSFTTTKLEDLTELPGTWIIDSSKYNQGSNSRKRDDISLPGGNECIPVYDIELDGVSQNAYLLNVTAAPFVFKDANGETNEWHATENPKYLSDQLMAGDFGDVTFGFKGIGSLFVLSDPNYNITDGNKYEPYTKTELITSWKTNNPNTEHKISACVGVNRHNSTDPYRPIGTANSGCPNKNNTMTGMELCEFNNYPQGCANKYGGNTTATYNLDNTCTLHCPKDVQTPQLTTNINYNTFNDYVSNNHFPYGCYNADPYNQATNQTTFAYTFVVDEWETTKQKICQGNTLFFGITSDSDVFSFKVEPTFVSQVNYKLRGYIPITFLLDVTNKKFLSTYSGFGGAVTVSRVGELYGYASDSIKNCFNMYRVLASEGKIADKSKCNSARIADIYNPGCPLPAPGTIISCAYASQSPTGEGIGKLTQLDYEGITSSITDDIPANKKTKYLTFNDFGIRTECESHLKVNFPTVDVKGEYNNLSNPFSIEYHDTCLGTTTDIANSPTLSTLLPDNKAYVKIMATPLHIENSGQTKEMYDKCGGDNSKGYYDNLCYCTNNTLYYDNYFISPSSGGCENTGIQKNQFDNTCSPVSSMFGIDNSIQEKSLYTDPAECVEDSCSPSCCYGATDGSSCKYPETVSCLGGKCRCVPGSNLCGPYCSEKCGYCDGVSIDPTPSNNFKPSAPGIKQEDKKATLSYWANSPDGCSEFIVEAPAPVSNSITVLVLLIILLVSVAYIIYYFTSVTGGTKKNISSDRYFNNF